MRFIKTIDLWKNNNEHKLRTGEIVLQRGQWVKCGDDGVKSRFVGIDGYSVNVVHGEDYKQINRRFMERVKHARLANKRSLLNVL